MQLLWLFEGLFEDTYQKILKQIRSFIPDEAKSDYMFGEDEFIAFLQQSTDPILKQYFNSEFHTK